MAKLNISQLNFDNIKANLKRYLSNQNQFKDYNFEGSGMAVLLDLLSYNTHYLSYHANIAANEMFIDTADIRESIVSLAKALEAEPEVGGSLSDSQPCNKSQMFPWSSGAEPGA